MRPHRPVNAEQACLTHQALVVRQHDNDLCIVVPNHPPEILDGVEKRMLGDDEFIALIITLHIQREDRKSLGM